MDNRPMADLQSPFFPKQAVGYSEKNGEWYKRNIETGVSLINYRRESGLRAAREEKISNVKLFNDEVDPKEIQQAINPYNLSGKFPDIYKNYPIANSNLNLLFGEESKRVFNPVAYVVNSEEVSSELNIVSQKFRQLVQEMVLDDNFNQEEAEKQLRDFDKWKRYTYRDQYERMANQVIQFYLNTTDIRDQWSKNFEDLLIQGEEIASIDVLGGELVFERLNPLDVYTFRSDNASYKIEDSDWIVISRFVPIGRVIDSYHDYLKKSDRDYLDEIYMSRTSGSSLFPDGQLTSETWDVNKVLQMMGADGNTYLGSDKLLITQNRNYDEQGNVRVTRVLWKGQRKIGILEYRDTDGTMQKKYVDEKYKADKEAGEKIKWEYISEWYEGTKIGNDIYVKYGPRPIQFRDPDNPSLCHPGIVGNILNTNSAKGKSLLSYMKPYQLLYNFFMYRLQQNFIKYQGHIARFNLATKPDKWSVEKVMFYMQQFGIYVEDPFNEGQEGAATGKLAGGLGHNPGSMQIGDHNMIMMNIQMLEFLEQRIADISGVTPQRKGAIANRETVGGVERSVMQSSNNTEKYFRIHDNFRLRCLKTIVETVKIAWKDKKHKRTFILDDNTKAILDFDGESFNMGVYGVATSTSSDVTNMMNDLKQLGTTFLQNDGDMVSIMNIYQTKDPTALKHKLEQTQEDKYRRQEESEKRQQSMVQQQIESQEAIANKQLEHERLLKELELNNKIQIELIKQNAQDNSIELEKLKQNEEKIKKELQLKEKDLNEKIRHNQQTESISRMQKANK